MRDCKSFFATEEKRKHVRRRARFQQHRESSCNKFIFPATQKKLAYLGFQCPYQTPYSPDLAPSDYHLFPGLKKKTIESSPFFVRRGVHCCRGDLVGRTTFLFFFFLNGLQKLEQRAKRFIELRGEYVE